MGCEKGLLTVNAKPLVQKIRDEIGPFFDEILLSTNDPEKYAFLDLKMVPDQEKSRGPLMGIYSSLQASSNEINFIIACDFPEINIPFMHEMIEYADCYDAVVPYTEVDKKEPLFSVYRRSLLGKIKDILDEGKNKISFLFECCRVKYLHMEDASWCKNINTPEDYQNFLDRFCC